MRRTIAERALGPVDKVDNRTLAFLRKQGMVSRATGSETDPLVRQALTHEPELLETGHPLGPLVFVKKSETSILVVDMLDVLVGEEPDLRSSAAKHVERLEGAAGVLTPRSQDALNRNRRKLQSRKPSAWRNAAVEAHDCLRDDFLLELATFKQCISAHFEEGARKHENCVFHPSISSISSIVEPMCTVSRLKDDVRKAMASLVKGAKTLLELLQRYFATCGHLTLAGELSIAGVAQNWFAEHPAEESAWGVVWNWADGAQSPYARYHACQIFAQHPRLVPTDAWETLWREVAQILLLSRPEGSEEAEGEAWRIRCALAKHYCQHLECSMPPGDSAETVAAFSWWLAERVSSVFGLDEARLAKLRSGALLRHTERTSRMWELARPWATPSALRYVTLKSACLWSTALAAQLLPAIERTSFEEVSDATILSVTKGLIGCVATQVPLQSSSGDDLFAFQLSVLPVVNKWLSVAKVVDVANRFGELSASEVAIAIHSDGQGNVQHHDPQSRPSIAEQLYAFANAVPRIENCEQVVNYLCRLPDADETDAGLISGVLQAAAYNGLIDIDSLWATLSSEEWRSQVLSNSCEQALQMLFDTLAELQYRADAVKRCELPHFFAELVEKGVAVPERAETLFVYTVLMSAYTDTSSALLRLRTSKRKAELEPYVQKWNKVIDALRKDASPWVAARIRAVLCALS